MNYYDIINEMYEESIVFYGSFDFEHEGTILNGFHIENIQKLKEN